MVLGEVLQVFDEMVPNLSPVFYREWVYAEGDMQTRLKRLIVVTKVQLLGGYNVPQTTKGVANRTSSIVPTPDRFSV